MSSSIEKNSSGKKKKASWKSHKVAFTLKSKDIVVLENNINLPSTNLLGADTRGTVLANDVDLVDIQHDDPPPNLQQSTSSTTKVGCHTRKCTNIGDRNFKGYLHDDPRALHKFCDTLWEEKRLSRVADLQNNCNKKNKVQKIAHDEF